MRIGQGIDVHAFQDGGTLRLGGVTVPCDRSLKAHSDGDVALHALCDALLGAAAAGAALGVGSAIAARARKKKAQAAEEA